MRRRRCARPDDAARARCEGVDVAYYLVHSMAAGRGFGALDREAARNFGRAAAAAGVRRIVYLGGLIPANPRSEHLRSRAETGDVLRASGVPVTELRAGMIIGPGSAAYEVIRDLVNHLPVMVTPRWVKSRLDADRARRPARVPGRGGGHRRSGRQDARRRRAGHRDLRGDHALLRPAGRPATR